MRRIKSAIGIICVFLLVQFIGAQTWQATKRLTYNSGGSYYPAIAVGPNDFIHVVWDDTTPVDHEIYYKRSTNGGTTWTTKRLTYTIGNSVFSDVAVDSSNHVHIVWGDPSSGNFEIFYRKSTDGGQTWDSAKKLTWNAGDSNFAALAVNSSSGIHVVWYDDTPGNHEIYSRRSTNGGSTWTVTKRLTWNSGSSYHPTITVDSTNNIHMTWNDDSNDGNFEIYCKRSTDGGSTWPKFKRLTRNAGDSFRPVIAVGSSSTIHVAWHDRTFLSPDIFYRRSTDGGNTWDGAKRLTWNAGFSEYPAIASDANNRIHVVWQDNSPGNLEIYHKRSTNAGSTWSKQKRLTWNPGPSYNPDIAVDSSDTIHVVWSDVSTGNLEMYYKKGIQ